MIGRIAGARRRSRRRRNAGFTLIELLVVIVILGIISGVVVFAVRGAGDKGEAKARAADKRIVRTAMETFCARYGRYAADMDELVNGPRNGAGGRLGKGFLSEASTYNATIVSAPPGENTCGGTGYIIGDPPRCFQLDADGDEVEVAPKSGQWCLAAKPEHLNGEAASENNVIQLANGGVLVIGRFVEGLPPVLVNGRLTTSGFRTAVFDPAAGPKGAWTEAAVARTSSSSRPMAGLLIDGTPQQCGERCGNVLAFFRLGSGDFVWQLFDPDGDDGVEGTVGSWVPITPGSPQPRYTFVETVQLLGSGCDPQCGKVLTVGTGGAGEPDELYDPVFNTFELLTVHGTETNYRDPKLTELSDGRVLLVTRRFGTSRPVFLLDPELRIAEPMIVEPQGFYLIGSQPTVLPDGGVLFLYSGRFAEIYTPEVDGQGQWERLGRTCATQNVDSTYCHHLATLHDGRVLVNRAGSQRGGIENLLFNPIEPDPEKKWTDNASPNTSGSIGFSVRLSRGPCGGNCNRVLTVGRDNAEFFLP